MAKVTIDRQASGFRTVELQNKNAQTIEEGFDNSISRDGAAPNQMEAELDMNSNHIVNLPDALSNSSPLTLGQASAIKSISQTMSKELIKPYLGDITAAATSGIIVTNSDAANNVTEDTALVFDADSLPTAVGANITTATEVVVSDNLSQSVLTPISSILALAAAAAPSRAYFRKLITRWKNVTHIYLGEGECTDDTGAVKITHTNDTFEKSITGVWDVGSGAGQGCRATNLGNADCDASQTYFVFIIAKADGTTDFVMDTVEAGTNVLSGATATAEFIYKRCVGIVCTDASKAIVEYKQVGDEFMYKQGAVSITSASHTETLLDGVPNNEVPTEVEVTLLFQHLSPGQDTAYTVQASARSVGALASELNPSFYSFSPGGHREYQIRTMSGKLLSNNGKLSLLKTDNQPSSAVTATVQIRGFTFQRSET